MSVGMVLLTAAAILVFFGVAQRVLDKMYLSDRAALLLIALMFFGTLIPTLKLGTVELSIGGALIPAGVCVYLLIRAGTWKERLRAIVGTLVMVGRGQRDADWVAEVLAARDRQAAGENAPARGLIFWSVGY